MKASLSQQCKGGESARRWRKYAYHSIEVSVLVGLILVEVEAQKSGVGCPEMFGIDSRSIRQEFGSGY